MLLTVKEICEIAEINRTTFYKHYLDAYDLLEQIESKLLGELKEILSNREQSSAKDVLTLIMVSLKLKRAPIKQCAHKKEIPLFRQMLHI